MHFDGSYFSVDYSEAEKFETKSRVADPPYRGGEPTLGVANPACLMLEGETFIIGHVLGIQRGSWSIHGAPCLPHLQGSYHCHRAIGGSHMAYNM